MNYFQDAAAHPNIACVYGVRRLSQKRGQATFYQQLYKKVACPLFCFRLYMHARGTEPNALRDAASGKLDASRRAANSEHKMSKSFRRGGTDEGPHVEENGFDKCHIWSYDAPLQYRSNFESRIYADGFIAVLSSFVTRNEREDGTISARLLVMSKTFDETLGIRQ